MNDDLGDRMKLYEEMEAGRRLMPGLPALARLDGKCFHNFTKGMDRPYDERLSNLMIDTTIYLVKETNACMGYTQSDEITLCWYVPSTMSQIYFDGRITKMTSVLAAQASVVFNDRILNYFEGLDYSEWPVFDCRVWTVPKLEEAANVFLWREQDATKNSIQMAARTVFSHKECENKNGKDLQEMLFQKGINWNDYPSFFKRGTFIQRKRVARKFTTEELDKLPPKHAAKTNPELMVERTEYHKIEMPPFGKVINRVEVIFEGENPVVIGG